jgi:hypothetical protein
MYFSVHPFSLVLEDKAQTIPGTCVSLQTGTLHVMETVLLLSVQKFNFHITFGVPHPEVPAVPLEVLIP